MAEMKKESKGTKRYGHGPRIEPKGGESGKEKGDLEKSGTPSNKEAAKTAGDPKATAGYKETDLGPAGSEEAGTKIGMGADGVPITDRHAGERDALHAAHMGEHHEMHNRHQAEHRTHKGDKMEMHERHEKERKELHTAHERDHRTMHNRHEKEMAGTKELSPLQHEGKDDAGTEPD